MRNRWLVFAVQFVAVSVPWGLFLVLAAKHPIDGWFVALVVGVGLAVALVGLWSASRRG
ncbi:MAG TPA: hypothetical protein VIT43_09040 [Candidatus Dormibacteraeota bacterium]